MSIQKPQKKLYYSLRQVAEMADISPTELKNWEAEFTQLSPMRNRAGNRYYSAKDVDVVFRIKEYLLEYELGMEETRKRLNKRPDLLSESEAIQLKRILAEIKLEINEIQALLEE